MICKGPRPDGTQCDAPEEYVSPDTGLCWSCAAPESKALVRCERPEVEFDEELPLKCRVFLEAYMQTCRLGASAKLLGMSPNQHKIWLGEVRGKQHLMVPGYPEAFEIVLEDVRAQADDELLDTIKEGLKEVMLDADGNVKHTRWRQSEGVLKMYLQSLNPEKYAPDRSGANNNVVIVLNHTNEGGWVDPPDTIAEAVVLSDDEAG